MISKGTLKNYFNGILLKVMSAKEASGYGDTEFASYNIAQEDKIYFAIVPPESLDIFSDPSFCFCCSH